MKEKVCYCGRVVQVDSLYNKQAATVTGFYWVGFLFGGGRA